MKLIYLALAGGSLEHNVNKQSQINTWADNKNPMSRMMWMHGDSSVKSPILEGHSLYVPVEEKYSNLLEKTVLSTQWILKNFDFDFLIRTNTSNYFFDPLVRKYLTRVSGHSNTSGGVIAYWRGSIDGIKKNHRYISGAGIFLSRYSAETLSNLDIEMYLNVPDDVAIGHWLEQNGTKFFSIPRNNVTDFKLLWPSPQTRVKSWLSPTETLKRMQEIHSIYKARDTQVLGAQLGSFFDLERVRCIAEKPRRIIFFTIHFLLLQKFQKRYFRKVLNLK